VEPCLLFFSICQGLYVIAAQNLYIQKVCQVNLNFSEEICINITHNKVEQAEVQKYVSVLQGANGVLQAIPAIVYALFAGPWSDIHGRRLLIICSCFGYVFNNGVFIINTIWFHELKAEYLLFECLQDCTGGYVCFFLACYAYIADISTKEKRTRRLAFLDGLFPAGFFLGMASSGHIQDSMGLVGNFSLGIFFALLAMLYAIFFLKDSRDLRPPEVQRMVELMKEQEPQKEPKGRMASLFDIDNVKNGFKSVFRKREKNLRTFVILLAITFVLEIFLINGKGPTQYLYFRRKFSWGKNKFGSYVGIFGFLGIFAQYVMVPLLSECAKLHDSTLGLIAIASCIVQQIWVAYIPAGVEYEWMIYASGAIAFLSVTITTTCRSLVTKCVGPLEVGKVFSVMGAFQAAVPLAASPTYAYIYKSTVEEFPGAFLLFSAAVYLVVMSILFVVNCGMHRAGLNQNNTDQEMTIVAPQMEQLLNKKHEEEKKTKLVLETAPLGDRFQEVAVYKERYN